MPRFLIENSVRYVDEVVARDPDFTAVETVDSLRVFRRVR